ncbi:alpha-(1-_3)-arabinofuranosyltransferase domain-containing protein [Streptomyces chartreusis]|uniref:alpha-(1->3)-arabinofuranosyltransferase domain-containing protein n=1 Tax=Streptomyces chartreusis TaxID=1969 RepID=UPI0036C1F097
MVASPSSRSGPFHPGADTAREQRRWRLRHMAMCLVFLALTFNTSPGQTSPDTKVDLTVDPWQFLARALQLWDGQGFAGQLQNQAYGYLFPMGPFFGIAHSIGAPGWAVQRLWWAVLMAVAYLGVVALAHALTLGSPLSRMLGAVAYACSPHVLTLLGANSVESLPLCVAPWLVLPLVQGIRRGEHRRAGLLCGLAAFCLGGVNAAADLAALLPAVLLLLAARPPLRLVVWTLFGVVLGTAWWVVPLLLLGRYSPPFLDYIENANTTTAVTSLTEALRGTADWVAYLPSSGWHAGYLLLTSPAFILNTLLVVAAGLAGLAALRIPAMSPGPLRLLTETTGRKDEIAHAQRSWCRSWLLSCLALGLLLVTAGHPGPVAPIGATAERHLLDGVLAPIRNVHKFDLLIRMPIALGIIGLLPRLRWGRNHQQRHRSTVLIQAVAAVAVAGAAAPLLSLQIAANGHYNALPGYWEQTATWLAHQPASNGRALLVPASPTATYLWGTPTDEPIQPLARSAWDVRNNIPLTTPGHIRMLDEVEQLLASGRAQPALASYLRRGGFGYLVVRNDLKYNQIGALPPAVVHATLASSPGLTEVATFGPAIGNTGDYSYSVDQGLDVVRPAVEIWQVRSDPATSAGASSSSDARLAAVPAASVARLSGGPESIAQLDQDGSPPLATVGAGQSVGALRPGSVILTDGLRRREVNYGGAPGQRSPTLAADDQGSLGRKVPDYTIVTGTSHQSVVRYLGAKQVTASSSAAQPDSFGPVRPDEQAWSAFDSDPSTAWVSAPGTAPVGQWIEVTLNRRYTGNASFVQLRQPTAVTRIKITTDSWAASYPVGKDGRVKIDLTGRRTVTTVRVTITGVTAGYTGQVAIDSVTLPGAGLARTIVTPRDEPAHRPVDVIDLATPGDARNGCLLIDGAPQCVAGRARASEDGASLDRTVYLRVAAQYRPSVTITPRPGAALNTLLTRSARLPIEITASSQAVRDPLAGPSSLIDRDPRTGWVAAVDDPDPTLRLRWQRVLKISHFRLFYSPALAASRPDRAVVEANGTRRSATIDADGTVRFAPLRTNHLTLHLRSGGALRPIVASTVPGQLALGIGLSDIEIPGVPEVSRSASDERPVILGCGSGPRLVINGHSTPTFVRTTVGAVRNLDPITATPCNAPAEAPLAARANRILLVGTNRWDAASLRLTRVAASSADKPSHATAPGVTVREWKATTRTAAIGLRTTSTLLVVNENANPGWAATFNGRPLNSITVDGWRQAYVIPAGRPGVVVMRFMPQRTYAAGLLCGAAGVLILFALIWFLGRRRGPSEVDSRLASGGVTAKGRRLGSGLTAVMLCTLLGGAAGAVAGLGTVAVLRWARGINDSTGRSRHDLVAPTLAAVATMTAAVALAWRPYGTTSYAANTWLLQVVCLIAIAAVVAATDRRPAEGRDTP